MSNENQKVTKTIVNAEGKRVKRPIQQSNRKRSNRNFIEKTAEIRGFMTGNERTSLSTLTLKNAWQRINNRTMSDDVNNLLSWEQNNELQRLIKEFVTNVDNIIKKDS